MNGNALWSIATIIGPLILFVLLIVAILRNRSSRSTVERSEEATRDNYAAEEQARRDGTDAL